MFECPICYHQDQYDQKTGWHQCSRCFNWIYVYIQKDGTVKLQPGIHVNGFILPITITLPTPQLSPTLQTYRVTTVSTDPREMSLEQVLLEREMNKKILSVLQQTIDRIISEISQNSKNSQLVETLRQEMGPYSQTKIGWEQRAHLLDTHENRLIVNRNLARGISFFIIVVCLMFFALFSGLQINTISTFKVIATSLIISILVLWINKNIDQ